MSLLIATGSNLGDKLAHLKLAQSELALYFKPIAQSRVYSSAPVDFTNQPDFLNQVLEFEIPALSPHDILNILLDIEKKMGRVRNISKGPRVIDLDILFIGEIVVTSHELTVPHPELFKRSFVVFPLSELPYFESLKTRFHFSFEFETNAYPFS